jgi:hypothetical protein
MIYQFLIWTLDSRQTSPSQESKIEDTAQPTILRPHQVQVILDPKDRRIAESRFINVKERIADC